MQRLFQKQLPVSGARMLLIASCQPVASTACRYCWHQAQLVRVQFFIIRLQKTVKDPFSSRDRNDCFDDWVIGDDQEKGLRMEMLGIRLLKTVLFERIQSKSGRNCVFMLSLVMLVLMAFARDVFVLRRGVRVVRDAFEVRFRRRISGPDQASIMQVAIRTSKRPGCR